MSDQYEQLVQNAVGLVKDKYYQAKQNQRKSPGVEKKKIPLIRYVAEALNEIKITDSTLRKKVFLAVCSEMGKNKKRKK